jgi:hypothetical protein
MLTKSIEVMKYVRASAGRAGLSVVFEDTNQPRHDGKTIYLPKITDSTTDEQLRDLMASTDHEVAHDRFSCFEVLKEKDVDPKGIVLFIWNFLEDSRINNIEALEYQGFRENYDECSASIVERIFKKSTKDPKFIAKLTTALIHWESNISVHNFPKMQLVTSKATPDKTITNVLNNFSDRLVHCHSILNKKLGTESTFKLAMDILEKLGKECSEEFQKSKKATESEEGSDGERTDNKAEKKEGKPKKSEEKAESGEAKKEDDEEYKIITLKLTEDEIEKYSISLPEENLMGKVGINLEPSGRSGYDWTLTDYNKFIVINYPKTIGESTYFRVSPSFIREYENRAGTKLVAQENFAQQVRKLIQIRAKVQRQYGVKKGKLDQSRLSRICFNAPGFNERVFKNKIENKTLDACVSVLVDMSGSMSGDKVFYALASTLLLNEVCTTLNIPVEIVGFTDGYLGSESVPMMFVYKSFNDLLVSADKLKEYFSCSSSWMTGNPDGENILWSFDRIAKRKEKKKLLIVMSDGSPAASRGYDGLEEFTSKVIKEIEASKAVDIYGLGLCSNAVSRYYKAHSIVNNPEEIPKNLLELIERKILT